MLYLRLFCLATLLGVWLASCGPKAATFTDLNTRNVILPGGNVIQAETMVSQLDLARGLMFRTALAPDHGMLFVHKKPGLYSYFLYQHEIPLDIIWMDSSHDIVEIVENAPPCKTAASQCPHFGGTKVANYVLELAAGMARKYKLDAGQRVEF